MQLKDLVKPLSQMTDDELIERVRLSKQNRTIVRPAHRAHVERAQVKTKRAATKKVTDLFEGMSPEDRATLIKQLEEGDGS